MPFLRHVNFGGNRRTQPASPMEYQRTRTHTTKQCPQIIIVVRAFSMNYCFSKTGKQLQLAAVAQPLRLNQRVAYGIDVLVRATDSPIADLTCFGNLLC